ncbi:DUF2516 family protein [Pengzhenrongella sicca]|uniref:DUF2516 family protein n=1 Tax=Pengzhenrongella sicca TaxID=2819238 RepID=A0A8A4ZBD6_9MICO|nr:DUF2516 family protein [Pengzhenrongella sicca]QTE29212.1 DUF2516 family protein [Pengzhenrongella sicca]
MILYAQQLIYFALFFVVFVLAVWALGDAMTRPTGAFTSAGKRTKNFWLLLTGAATAVAFVAIPAPLGLGLLSFLALGAAVAAIVYLVDVRPAIRPYSGRRGGRGKGPGGRTPPRGGW